MMKSAEQLWQDVLALVNEWEITDHIHRIVFLSDATALTLNQHRLTDEIGGTYKTNFSNAIENLLANTFRFSDRSAPAPIETDLAIAHCFRNHGANRIEDQPIVCNNFERIITSILNALFYSIGTLY
jgi:hypothetical protein